MVCVSIPPNKKIKRRTDVKIQLGVERCQRAESALLIGLVYRGILRLIESVPTREDGT